MIQKYNNAAPPRRFKNTAMISTINGKPPEWVTNMCKTDNDIRTSLSSSNSHSNYKCAILYRDLDDDERALLYLDSVFRHIEIITYRHDYIDDYLNGLFGPDTNGWQIILPLI